MWFVISKPQVGFSHSAPRLLRSNHKLHYFGVKFENQIESFPIILDTNNFPSKICHLSVGDCITARIGE